MLAVVELECSVLQRISSISKL